MKSQIVFDNQTIAFTGDITFSTVQSLENQIAQKYSVIIESLTVDFALTAKVDTSALALCLSMQRRCQKMAVIHFENIPQCLHDIAASVGVENIFLNSSDKDQS